MKIRIVHEGERRLDADMLMNRVLIDGYVIFVSTRGRQRELGRAIYDLLIAQGMEIMKGETQSPNWCMCVVDTERHDFWKIREAAAQQDYDDEAKPLDF